MTILIFSQKSQVTQPFDEAAPPTSLPVVLGASTRACGQYLTFELSGQQFGVSLDAMQEVVQLPPLEHMPLAPACWLGLGNLRGQTLPVLSLQRLLDLPAEQAGPQQVLVVAGKRPLGIAIDRVAGIEHIDGADIESIRIGIAGASQPLLGTVQRGDGVLTLLALDKLITDERLMLGMAENGGRAASADGPVERIERQRLVSYVLDGQEYATPIEQVLEILPVPTTMLRMPRADHALLGVMSLRGKLLTLVCLRRVFGLSAERHGSYVVVLSLAGARALGVVVDGVKEVFSTDSQTLAALPDPFGHRAEKTLDRLCQLDGGHRLVGLIDAHQLAVRTGMSLDGEPDAAPHHIAEAMPEEELVVCCLDQERFGLPIGQVQEIVTMPPQLIRLADQPAGIHGYLNLRGQTIPIIDLRTRLGRAPASAAPCRRIVLLATANGPVGLIVDQVREILRLPLSRIMPAPLSMGNERRVVDRVANLGGSGLVQLLDTAVLVGQRQPERLALA